MNKLTYIFSWCKYKIQHLWNNSTGSNKTVVQETSEYEKSVLTRFLSTAFVPVEKMEVLDPPVKMLQQIFYRPVGIIDPWLVFAFSWFIHVKNNNKMKNNVTKKQIRNYACNSQVDSIFFDRKELKNILENPMNELESTWKSRILIEHTPRGNVIMFYNAYKEAFAYYSDQTAMPYRILNVVAMKYVMRYHCADFFIDETVLGGKDTNPSLFISMIKDEINAENQKKKQVVNTMVGKEDSPFLKVKQNMVGVAVSANSSVPSVDVKKQNTKSNNPVDDIMKNRFVYMGKISNFNILKKPPKKRQMPIEWANFISEYDEMFELQKETQQNCMDYKMFKKLKQIS